MVGHGLDRAARSAGPEVVALVEGVSAWALALQGQMPLRRGLAALAEAFGAEAVALSRVGRAPGATARTLVADAAGHMSVPIDRSFAAALLGSYIARPRVGTTWHSSLTGGDGDPALARLQSRRRLAELVVVVIGIEDKAVHVLELHFAHRLGAECHGLLGALTGTLVAMWDGRATGCFSEALLAQPSSRSRAESGAQSGPGSNAAAPILSLANPARLSRAEFRLCTLLAAGLSARRARDELAISQSTLSSHLRQIYAKTGTQGLADLLYRLLATPGAAVPAAPAAMRRVS